MSMPGVHCGARVLTFERKSGPSHAMSSVT